MEYKSSNTEIDLLEVFIKFCSIILKNKILIISCTILGLLAGYALSMSKKPKWEASFMFSTTLLSPQEGEFLMNDLITSAIFRLKGGEHVLSLDKTIRYDNSSKNLFLQLRAATDSKDVFPELQKESINYINKSEPVQRKIKVKKAYYSDLINKVTIELESLEKLKTKMVNQASISTFSPSDLSVKSIELYNNKIQYQQALKDLDAISFLVKGFEPVEVTKPTNMFVALGAGLGLFLATLIILLKFFIPHYRKFINTQG